ncbi:unnamed protein product [Ilex paraguariensis]|uniref:Uncharacterized protein n=1 Tax=Ilex paraguariensis TaxID=185542 RepID=A0ABC8V5Z6_9AQUA
MESFDYLEYIDCTPLYDDIEWDPVLAALQAGPSNHHQAQEQDIPVSAKLPEMELVRNVPDSEIAEALAVLSELPKHLHGARERLPAPEMDHVPEAMPVDHQIRPLYPISNEDYNTAEILLMLEDSSLLESDEALRLEDKLKAEPEPEAPNPRKRRGRPPKVTPKPESNQLRDREDGPSTQNELPEGWVMKCRTRRGGKSIGQVDKVISGFFQSAAAAVSSRGVVNMSL